MFLLVQITSELLTRKFDPLKDVRSACGYLTALFLSVFSWSFGCLLPSSVPALPAQNIPMGLHSTGVWICPAVQS